MQGDIFVYYKCFPNTSYKYISFSIVNDSIVNFVDRSNHKDVLKYFVSETELSLAGFPEQGGKQYIRVPK